MSQKVWLGRIYLREEGGYEIILRALHHYKKRLKNIGRSPELKDAPMFAQLVQHEAGKTGPLIDPIINKIKAGLQNPESLESLRADIPIFEKALNCYQSDIQKSQASQGSFYSDLISDKNVAASDLAKIKDALGKINQFS
ncbi:MAG: hypothetical protein WAO91_06835 [Candidatus Nitrosotenuis sp.]